MNGTGLEHSKVKANIACEPNLDDPSITIE